MWIFNFNIDAVGARVQFALSSLCVFFLLLQFYHHFLYRSPNHAVRLSKYNFSFFIHHQSNGTNVKSCLNFSAAAAVVVVMASMNECSFLLPKMVNTSTHASENSSLIIFFKNSLLIKLISVSLNGSNRFFLYVGRTLEVHSNQSTFAASILLFERSSTRFAAEFSARITSVALGWVRFKQSQRTNLATN